MALSFGLFGGNQNLTNISGVQFEQEAQNTKVVQHVSAGGSPETVYTVPAGKNLFIGCIIISNSGVQTYYPWIEVGGVVVYYCTVLQKQNDKMDFAIPFLVTAGTVIGIGNLGVGQVTLLGWEA